eukprot:17466-Pyramimonas_sp.AAC.1
MGQMKRRGHGAPPAHEAIWSALIKKKVLSTVHKYKEINGNRAGRMRLRSRLPKHLFQPSAHGAGKRVNLKGVSGFTQSPPWHSPGVANLGVASVDLE